MRHKETKLTAVRKPTPAEKKRGAEVVFEREDSAGREYTILACTCYESWEQWGEVRNVLSDNCSDVEAWRHGSLAALNQDEHAELISRDGWESDSERERRTR